MTLPDEEAGAAVVAEEAGAVAAVAAVDEEVAVRDPVVAVAVPVLAVALGQVLAHHLRQDLAKGPARGWADQVLVQEALGPETYPIEVGAWAARTTVWWAAAEV